MWVIAPSDSYFIEWQLWQSLAVTPPFSNSTPCFVWVQGQRGSALVSLAHREALVWPPPNSGSQSLPLVLLVQTQSLVFDIIFFSPSRLPQRGSERREPVCEAWWCGVSCCCSSPEYSLEVVCMFQKGSNREWRELEQLSLQPWQSVSNQFKQFFFFCSLCPVPDIFLLVVLKVLIY